MQDIQFCPILKRERWVSLLYGFAVHVEDRRGLFLNVPQKNCTNKQLAITATNDKLKGD